MDRYDLRLRMLVMHRNSKIGQTVLARVLKINPKNILVQYETGVRWNTSPALLEPAPAGSVFEIDEAEGLELADPVRFVNNPKAGDHIYAVLDVKDMLYKVARIGGSKNRYFYRIPASELVRVPNEELGL
jgi:hypothetical protein